MELLSFTIVFGIHPNDLHSTQNSIYSSRKLESSPLKTLTSVLNALLTTITILVIIGTITSVAIIKIKNKPTKSKFEVTTTVMSTTTTMFATNIDFDSATLRFLFTMINQSPNVFTLIKSDRWYGHLDAPDHNLEAGNATHSNILQIRGVKSTQFGTGVTYALCFCIHNKNNYRLNIYLQVASFFHNNYFGWTLREGEICDQAKTWCGKDKFNRIKENCADPVLNKGGTLSLTASCDNMKIEMLTDDLGLSTPNMIIQTEDINED
ncbi:unnamed protein product [Adineta ricciae]|uniref:Uncharacterized protein n=1 Tax=Adineta ricciae TaxID=249248 RepID=A0A813S532_ADIRI|nr:unnamed protein product [Adineta ricciae]